MRIAQLTDLHLRHHLYGMASKPSRRSRDMPRLLDVALSRIAEQRVDLLAVTGDLLDVPLWLYQPSPGFERDTVAPWVEAAEADYRLVRDRLGRSGLPYMVLPGNHDWDEVMWRVFDPADHVREVAGHRVVRFCDHEHDGHVPRRFHPEHTRWREELARGEGPPQVHLQHYVITPPLNAGYPHTYGEGAWMVRAISGAKQVALCLSGHYHAGTDLQHHGGTGFATGPAFCEPPFPWRVYELHHGQVTVEACELGDAVVPPRPVVFLDRDGVVNDLPSYHYGPERMRLIPGAAKAIRMMADQGYAIVIVTNQSCVGQGYVPMDVVFSVNDKMSRLLADEGGAAVDAIYLAPGAGEHAALPRYADKRSSKPSPDLLLQAKRELNLTGGWMVGDAITDAMAARAAGVQPILVRTGRGVQQEQAFREAFPDARVEDDLLAAARHLLSQPVPDAR